MLLETNAQIVPIALSGTKELLMKGSVVPGKANVAVQILDPISKGPDESLEDWAARTRDIISQKKDSPESHRNILDIPQFGLK